jgi:hypothetical protein
MDFEDATGTKEANVKSGGNGHKAIEYREIKEMFLGPANLLRLFGI